MLIKILSFFGIIILYVFLINVFALVLEVNIPLEGYSIIETSQGGPVNVGVSDSVSVSVERQRFYGKYIEYLGKESKVVNLYIFNFIKLPIHTRGVNFIYIHIAFISLLILVFLIINLMGGYEYE